MLGLLTPDDLLAIAERCYRERVDLDDPDALEPFRWEAALVEPIRSLSPGGRMLDVFCGSGREAAIFARAGFEVTGVDYHAPRIARARSHASSAGFAARFIHADFDRLQLAERFDAVYLSPWMYGTYPGRERRIALLQRMAGVLVVGGLVIISYPLRERTPGAILYYRIAKAVSLLTLGNTGIEVGDRMLSSYFLHSFEAGEAEGEAASARLQAVHQIDHGRAPGGSPLRFLVLRAEAR